MTPEEKAVSAKLRELITRYENSTVNSVRDGVLLEINALREVTELDVNHYWRGRSLDEFCDSLAIERVWGSNFSQEEAIPVIKEMCALSPEEFEDVIKELRSTSGGPICL
jgi:hypothetical protein